MDIEVEFDNAEYVEVMQALTSARRRTDKLLKQPGTELGAVSAELMKSYRQSAEAQESARAKLQAAFSAAMGWNED